MMQWNPEMKEKKIRFQEIQFVKKMNEKEKSYEIKEWIPEHPFIKEKCFCS